MHSIYRRILLLVAFCLAFAGGAWLSIERRAAHFAAGVESRLAQRAKASPTPIRVHGRAFETDAEMLTAIMTALLEEDPLHRGYQLFQVLGKLGSSELASLFEHVVRIENQHRDMMLAAVLARWAEIDPAGATAALAPYRDRFRKKVRLDGESLDLAIYRAWAETFPEAALADAMSAPRALWAYRTAQFAWDSLGDGDPARKLDLLTAWPSNPLHAKLCARAIQELAEKDSRAAEARLDLLPDPRQRARLQTDILGKLAEQDPAAALARLAELAPELSGTTGAKRVRTVLEAAARKDVPAALEIIDKLPPEMQTPAIGSILGSWVKKDPLKALEWAAANGIDIANTKPSVSLDSEFMVMNWTTLMMKAFEADHAKTLDWLRTQPASAGRDTMLRDGIWFGTTALRLETYAELTPAGQARYARDMIDGFYGAFGFGLGAQGAQTWAEKLPAGQARSKALEALVRRQVESAPDRLDSFVDTWTSGADRDAALAGAVTATCASDPQRALAMARRVSDPIVREEACEEIARQWLAADQAAARVWIAGALELSSEQKRVILRQFDER